MPLYDFKCQECGNQFELFASIDQDRTRIVCPECKGRSKRVLVPGHGGIQTETMPWMNAQVRGCLQDDEEIRAGKVKPIETRSEYKKYLKANRIAER